MLTYLHIRNFGIFSDVHLELGPGLTVFTGETGAGKSMIVDAVMACLGYRTSPDTIRTGEDRAVLELLISPPKGIAPNLKHLLNISREMPEIMVQRDVLPERSYMRINGKIATMSMAQSIAAHLVDIHGQQDHHSLLQPQNNLAVLDAMAGGIVDKVKDEYRKVFAARQDIMFELSAIGRDASSRKREIDLLSYQVNEIEKAGLRRGEDDSLRQEHKILMSQHNLMEFAQEAYGMLYDGPPGVRSAYDQITHSLSFTSKIVNIDPSAQKLMESMEQILFFLEVAVDLLRDYQQGLSLEPSRLKQVEARLDLIERLKAKYGGSIDAILEYWDASSKRLARLLDADEILGKLQARLAQMESKLADLGTRLSEMRRKTSLDIEKRVSLVLEELDMPGARFSIVLEHQEDGETGILVGGKKIGVFEDGLDKATFLFSANPGEDLLPIHRVASGGELSRLMLAIKSCVEEKVPVPTLIFDEIDAGVGGKAGQAIGEKLWQLSENRQVLCVTHLASIAAMADTHFVVTKYEKGGRTYACVSKVDDGPRAKEIARMLSGTQVGVSLDHGKELIALASSYKQSSKGS